MPYLCARSTLSWVVVDVNGEQPIAECPNDKRAAHIVAALNLVERARRDFPGLVDSETDVNGGDLVELFEYFAWDADGNFMERASAAYDEDNVEARIAFGAITRHASSPHGGAVMADDERQELERMVREHGLRGLVNALADVVDDIGKRGESIPYVAGGPDTSTVDPGDLQTAAANLRREDLF
jgi:hypothetical protein